MMRETSDLIEKGGAVTDYTFIIKCHRNKDASLNPLL